MALIFAWLSLTGIIAGGIGYVYLSEPPAQLAEDASDSSHAPKSETAHSEPDSDQHSATTDEHNSAETHATDQEHASEDTHSTPAVEHQAESLQTESLRTESLQTESGHPELTNDNVETKLSDEVASSHSGPAATDLDETHTEAASHDDRGDTKAADGQSDPQAELHSDSQAAHDASTGEEETAKQARASTDDTRTEPVTKASEPVQQAALPKVTAPNYNSLPQWQRNRQNIDRRWLKDAEGNPKPRIAFVLSELGLAPIAAEEIIKKLPPGITLSFSPYAKPRSLEYLSALARSNGHEVMLDLPLEPIDFPQRDPGPKALLTALEPKENLDRLAWSLNRSTGYVGVAIWMGSRFVGSPRQMRPLYEAISDRGLLVLDNAEREDSLSLGLAGEFGVPTVSSHRYVDVPLASRDAIDARLAQVERIALQFGSAVAMGRPFPVTVERLAEWSADLEKRGILLVPITVLAEEVGRQQKLAYKPEKKSVPQAKATETESPPAD